MIETKKKLDRRTALRELSKLKKRTLQNNGRLPGNEKQNKAGGTRLLKEAIQDKNNRIMDSNRRVKDWANSEAGHIIHKFHGRIMMMPSINPLFSKNYGKIKWGKS